MRTVLLILGTAAFATASAATKPPLAAQDVAEKATDADGRMICKRFTETGSLALTHKVCATKREWDMTREDLRQSSSLNSCRDMAEFGRC